MKASVQTLSGSIYGITDTGWERVGRVPILGAEDETSGPLDEPVQVILGDRMRLPLSDGTFIVTTPVVRAEVLD